MPGRLKIRAAGTDARAMSDTAVTTTGETAPPANPDGMLLDGEAPRLGSAPIVAPAPIDGIGAPSTSSSEAPPAPPVASPVLTSPEVPMQPTGERQAVNAPTTPIEDLPTLPTAAPAVPLTTEDDQVEAETDDDGEPAHPMAHLMPPKSKPSEAAARAAEARAVKKAKAKKIKIAVAAGALLVAALAGPPLVSWLTNAINESGGLNTEEPAE